MVIRYQYNRMGSICPKQLEKFEYLRTNGLQERLSNLYPCLQRPGIGTPNVCESDLGY